jgi:ankyrin repeat protein
MIQVLSFLYYNNIPYKAVTENSMIFQKVSFSLEGIIKYNPGSQLFFQAVKFGEFKKVQEMLEVDKNYLFQYDYFYQTGYHWAAKRGLKNILELLIFFGNHINLLDMINRTPLHLAALNNNVEIVEVLINFKANPFLKSKDGKRAIDLATDPRIKLLLSQHEDVTII